MAPYSLIHIIDSDEVLSIPNPSERTPPSDRIRRAALHKFPGSQLSDLGHSRISKKEGRPYESVVGRGSAMKLLGENSRNASDRLAAVEKAIVTANQESSSIRKNLNQTNKRLAKTEKLAKDTNKEFYNFQRTASLDERPVVYFGLLCYLNALLVGRESGITDESSVHIDKLHKIVKNKSGLVATNKLVKAYVTKESVQQFTSLIDVKRRHFTAHPNLEPDVMLRKLFLIRRAAHERGDLNALGGAHLSIQLALAVTGAVKAKELLDKWKAAGSAGWGGFVAEDLLPYDDLLEGSE